MSETLQMVFRNTDERLATISVADPEPELTGAEVEAVMDSIIARNVFETTGGELVEKVRAQIVTRTVNVLDEF